MNKMTDPSEIVTHRIKLALGELVFDKIQLIVQAELLQKQIDEMSFPVEEMKVSED